MATKTMEQAAANGTKAETPIQALEGWLKEHGYTLVPVVIAPTQERISVLAAIKRELREDGWQPGFELVKNG